MLCQFSFENYKSYKDEATLDLFAEPISEHKDSLIVDKDNKSFLPVLALYGPNGGGKSNVLEAFCYFLRFILHLEYCMRTDRTNTYLENYIRTNHTTYLQANYHKFDKNCEKLPSKFNILFRTKNHEVNYELSILGIEVVEENLYIRKIGEEDGKALIEKTKNGVELYDILKDIPTKKISKNIPLLAYINASYNFPIIKEIVNWFLSVIWIDFGNATSDIHINVPRKKEEVKIVVSALNQMGINITDIRVVKDENNKIKKVFTIHTLKDGTKVELDFEDESSGTQKVFSLLMGITQSLNSGRLMVIDELDAKLHPKLLEYIIGLFTNKNTNKKGAQLIITSHDISTMNSDVFRRDEIWFCALNPDRASSLYSLISFKKQDGTKTRKDESFGKRYLEGKYGADLYLKKIIDWK